MKPISIILLSLIAILLALVWYQHGTAPEQQYDFTIITPRRTSGLQFDAIANLPRNIVQTNRGDTLEVFSMDVVFSAASQDMASYTTFRFASEDGGSLSLLQSEMESAYLLLSEKDGKPYLRLILPDDEFPQRWIKYITSITAEK
ncbi:MAG: hypothetical protein J7K89_01015 [Candidatus Cloacimonetes bacterium]|nr:hypothetical protein [Candidatus Cloacimonadota bacterium]